MGRKEPGTKRKIARGRRNRRASNYGTTEVVPSRVAGVFKQILKVGHYKTRDEEPARLRSGRYRRTRSSTRSCLFDSELATRVLVVKR
jgi:hypothetical protein